MSPSQVGGLRLSLRCKPLRVTATLILHLSVSKGCLYFYLCWQPSRNYTFSALHNDCYFLNKPVLELRCKLIDKATNSAPDPNAAVGPVNNAMMSMIRECNMKINSREVFTRNKDYAYRAYFSELFDFDSLAKNQKMRTQGFHMDTTGKYESVGNEGWLKRRSYFLESSKDDKNVFTSSDVTYMGALCTDFQGIDARKELFAHV